MTLLLLSQLAFAADPAPPPVAPAVLPGESEGNPGVIPGVPPGPPPPADRVQQLAYDIGVHLRCPVCQGLSVADSTSPAAVAMQNRVRELVAAGYDEAQIKAFFVERYGEWILLEPTTEGLNLLIWLLPGIGVGLGVAWAAATMLQWRKEPDDDLPSDRGALPKDRYEQRLLAELEE